MSARQFAASLDTIRRSEHTNRGHALARHLYWQARKLLFPRPVHLRLSRSTIMDDEPGGVIGLVNMLGRYDYNNMHFVQTVLAGSMAPGVFIDVGANIGAYTLIASEDPTAQVISLEPIPAAFAKLQRNVALNGRDNVTALNVGASAQPGTLHMTNDRASVFNRVVTEAGSEGTVSVPVDTLDAVCARLGVVPSLLKIDVEGHELEVLAGARALLPSCLACLIENGDRPAIVAFMHERGMRGPFHYRHRTATLGRTPQPVPEDHVFIGPGFAAQFPAIAIDPNAVGPNAVGARADA